MSSTGVSREIFMMPPREMGLLHLPPKADDVPSVPTMIGIQYAATL